MFFPIRSTKKLKGVPPLSIGSEGFTLVELMVSVGIIGVLAAVAIPNYNRFTAKARQTEAKVGLGAIYTSEVAYFADISAYSACLGNIGTNLVTKYYNIGFNSGGAADAAPFYKTAYLPSPGATAGTACSVGTSSISTTLIAYKATTSAGAQTLAASPYVTLATALPSRTAFTAAAEGLISSTSTNTTSDVWTVNETNVVLNTTQSLQ